MVNGHHLENRQDHNISKTGWEISVKFVKLMHICLRTLQAKKKFNFEYLKWCMAVIFKNKKIAISLQQLDRFRWNLARWLILAFHTLPDNKTSRFLKCCMAECRHLKNKRLCYCKYHLADFEENWYVDAHWPSTTYGHKKFKLEKLKMLEGQHFEKWTIATSGKCRTKKVLKLVIKQRM